MFAFAGSNTTSAYETFVGPAGPSVTTGKSATLFSYGDLAPVVTLKWGYPGPNYFMTYLAGDIPVGSYEAGRLNVFGIGHGAIDGGAGYSYFDGSNGFSAVAGLTYNFINPSTQYQNGIDAHLDLSAVRFVVPASSSSERSAMSTTSLPATAGPERRTHRTNPASLASVRRLALSFPPAA